MNEEQHFISPLSPAHFRLRLAYSGWAKRQYNLETDGRTENRGRATFPAVVVGEYETKLLISFLSVQN